MNETKTVTALTADGAPGAKIDLPGDLFDVQTNVPLIHQVVNAQLAAARQGTHATKTRAQVSGGGAKPWRQKGTGRARQGSRRAPQWTGGGIVHGPQPRSYAQRTPKKMIAAALTGALSDRARDDRIVILETLVAGEVASTKKAQAALACVAEYRNKLVVLDRDDVVGWLSARNMPDVHLLAVDQLNAYDVVCSDVVVFTKAALEEYVGLPLVAADDTPAKPAPKAAAAKAEPAPEAVAAAPEPAPVAEPVAEEVAETPKAKAEKAKAEPKAEAAADAPAEPKAEKPKAEKAEKAEKPKPEKAEKAEKPKAAKTEAEPKAEKADKPAKAETGADKAEKAEKAAPKAKAAKPASEEDDK